MKNRVIKNKPFVIGFLMILFLLICGILGRYVVLPIRENANKEIGETVEKDFDGEDLLPTKVMLTFEGNQEVSDNPWGITAGLIDVEEEGECVFLTPNTSAVMQNIEAVSKIQFSYMIHPWVKDESDGAGLKIALFDTQGTIIYVKDIIIDNTAEWEEYSLDIKAFSDADVLRLYCDNGVNDDDTCDWVIIRTEDELVNNIKKEDQYSIYGESTFAAEGYVKSATYFADEWPINFWNSEMNDLEEDFQQIKGDGFNSIILVIPWREFQTSINPIQYNQYAFDKLDEVLDVAEGVGLSVYTRIGYVWDFYQDKDDNIINRYCNLLGDNITREAWKDYLATMYRVLNKHDAFRGGFLTWEDFWGILGISDDINVDSRIDKAIFIGYQEWVKQTYSLDEYNEKYGTNYDSYTSIPVPFRNEPAMADMYAFFDDFLNRILKEAQGLFHNITLEVRMDWEPIYLTNGDMDYYKHTVTFPCEGADYTATMYGIPMGFENVGEQVDHEEALEKTDYILNQLALQNGGKPVYIEQFIFADNTPAFKNNARLKESELNPYLENVSDILMSYSEGYGIWTYRNYRTNMLYNPQFALDEEGWETEGTTEIITLNNSKTCKLEENGVLKQNIPKIRNHFDSEEYTLEFSAEKVEKNGLLSVSVGRIEKEIEIRKEGVIRLSFPKTDSFNLEIESDGCRIYIDDVRLFAQVQQGYLYDENNKELICVDGIREMNRQLH